MKRTLGALLLLPLMVPLAIQAQEAPSVKAGDRVRVTAPECHLNKQKGTLISLDRELIAKPLGGEEIRCPSGALTRLEVSVGERKWWKPALIGALVGAVGGAIMSPACEENAGSCLLVLPVVGGAVGFLAGSAVGLIIEGERWEEVHVPLMLPHFDLSAQGRLGFGLAIPFMNRPGFIGDLIS